MKETANGGKSRSVDKALSRRSTCRLCDNDDLQLAIPLRPTPYGDAYVSAESMSELEQFYPLDVYCCTGCGHLQHLDMVDPSLIFRHYNFATVSSRGLVDHFRHYAAHVSEVAATPEDSLVVEIGSNDGSLLRFFKERGLRILGVDPAQNIAAQATAEGIVTIPEFFTSALATVIREEFGEANLVCANNVYAHIDDIDDVTRGIKTLLSQQGVFVFEVSYLVDILQKKLFDTIYHEHLCYHSVAPLVAFFRKHDLSLFHVERIGTKGGSIRGYVTHAGNNRGTATSVSDLVRLEETLDLANMNVYKKFCDDLKRVKRSLHELLNDIKQKGATIAGFGASITVTTLLHHFELGPYLSFLLDDNPSKSGLWSPGYRLPVLHSSELYTRKPEYVIVLAWQYLSPIVNRHQAYLDGDGQFIVPLPDVEIVKKGTLN